MKEALFFIVFFCLLFFVMALRLFLRRRRLAIQRRRGRGVTILQQNTEVYTLPMTANPHAHHLRTMHIVGHGIDRSEVEFVTPVNPRIDQNTLPPAYSSVVIDRKPPELWELPPSYDPETMNCGICKMSRQAYSNENMWSNEHAKVHKKTQLNSTHRIGVEYLSAKSHGCSNCSTRFYRIDLLRRHQKVRCATRKGVGTPSEREHGAVSDNYTKNNIYACAFCSRSYASENALRFHAVHTCARKDEPVVITQIPDSDTSVTITINKSVKSEAQDFDEPFDTAMDPLSNEFSLTVTHESDDHVMDLKAVLIKMENEQIDNPIYTNDIKVHDQSDYMNTEIENCNDDRKTKIETQNFISENMEAEQSPTPDPLCSSFGYRCEYCKKIYRTSALLRRHERLRCAVKRKMSALNQGLAETLSTNSSSSNKKYVCPCCNKSYLSEKALQLHSIHTCSGPPESKVVQGVFGVLGEQVDVNYSILGNNILITKTEFQLELPYYSEQFDSAANISSQESNFTAPYQSNIMDLKPVVTNVEAGELHFMNPATFSNIKFEDQSQSDFVDSCLEVRLHIKCDDGITETETRKCESITKDIPPSIGLGPFAPGYQCKVCNKVLARRENLKYHKLTHTRSRRRLSKAEGQFRESQLS